MNFETGEVEVLRLEVIVEQDSLELYTEALNYTPGEGVDFEVNGTVGLTTRSVEAIETIDQEEESVGSV